MQIDSGLPLGIVAGNTYAEITLHLNPGDCPTFLSDGVVKAQNAGGGLFGFDRTRKLSTQSAEESARTAQRFGREDDITCSPFTFSLRWRARGVFAGGRRDRQSAGAAVQQSSSPSGAS